MDEKYQRRHENLKEQYYRRYSELKKEGKAFYPYSIFKDTVVSALVFLVLLALMVTQGTPLEAPADPTNTAYIPRPEWYFMFLFEMLKYFPGELEWVGVVLLPGLFILLLVSLPLLDRRPARLPWRRPVTVGATLVALAGIAFLTYNAYATTPTVAAVAPGRKLTAVEQAGKKLYDANCVACHGANGAGAAAGPVLAGIGAQRDAAYVHQYIENPKAVNAAAMMPGFLPPLTHEEVEQITRYVLALR